IACRAVHRHALFFDAGAAPPHPHAALLFVNDNPHARAEYRVGMPPVARSVMTFGATACPEGQAVPRPPACPVILGPATRCGSDRGAGAPVSRASARGL